MIESKSGKVVRREQLQLGQCYLTRSKDDCLLNFISVAEPLLNKRRWYVCLQIKEKKMVN